MYEYADAWIMTAQLNEKKNGCELCMRPLVLCKDCKYGKQLSPDYISCEISEENESGCHASHKPDWFCADGEHK